MKANELMVGDWLKCSDPTPFRITDIETEKGTSYFSVIGDDGWVVDGGELEPIPLTAEIMEKNLSTTSQIQYCWDDFLSNSFGEDFYEMRYHGDVTELVISIRYVHELQHVLKLCGIEKDIEL